MENHRRTLMAAEAATRAFAVTLVSVWSVVCVEPAQAAPLDQLIPNLFGGTLSTSITPQASADVQKVGIASRFRGLSAALAASRSQAPIPSATGAFRFAWDDDLDTYVRSLQSLGPGLAERAQTLGRHVGTVSVSYTHIDFDTLEGDRLDQLSASQPALSAAFLAQLPPGDRLRAQDAVLLTRLNFAFGYDLLFFTGAFGITDSFDVSLSLSVNRAHMRAAAQAMILCRDPRGNLRPCEQVHPGSAPSGAFFTVNQKGAIVGGSGSVCGTDFRCAGDGFDQSAFGTGDLFLRSKWHFYDTTYADLALVGVLTLPTGNADDFLGFHDPTFTPWFVASKTFGPVEPHLNLGYAFRSGQDVSQAQWIAGADVQALHWLSVGGKPLDWMTLAGDFLGYHDDKRDGINDDVIQAAVGFKINPFGQFVLAGNFQFPVNRDGLRADVIYTGQVEYTF